VLGQIALHCADLDSIESVCLLTASNSENDWKLLREIARNEVKA
jgi:hypothetical protein